MDGADDGSGGTGGSNGTVSAADEALLARVRAAPVLAGLLPRFDPQDAPGAPGELFTEWLDLALADGVPEPHVMTLSTASGDGTPTARVLMLRGIDTARCAYVFASDSRSRKGRDLAANPQAALTWYWPAHGRQIRMAGPVTVLGAEATRRDFLGRGEASRVAGFTGRMSEPLAGTGEYERERRAARELVAAEPDRVPGTHTVYRLSAREAEFFQADPGGFHVRVRYTSVGVQAAAPGTGGSGWTRTLLWP